MSRPVRRNDLPPVRDEAARKSTEMDVSGAVDHVSAEGRQRRPYGLRVRFPTAGTGCGGLNATGRPHGGVGEALAFVGNGGELHCSLGGENATPPGSGGFNATPR